MDILVMLEDTREHAPVLAHVNSVPSPVATERPARDIVTLYGAPDAESLALALAAAVESRRRGDGHDEAGAIPPERATGTRNVCGSHGMPIAAQRCVAAPFADPITTAGYFRRGYRLTIHSATCSALILWSLSTEIASNHPLQIYTCSCSHRGRALITAPSPLMGAPLHLGNVPKSGKSWPPTERLKARSMPVAESKSAR